MRAYVKQLPQSCLLVLCTNEVGCYPLAEALHRVLRSKPRSVWVDCHQVATLPSEALELLRRYARQLWRHGGYVVLCHLPAAIRALLPPHDAAQPLAASLLDAQQYGLDCPSPDPSDASPVAP